MTRCCPRRPPTICRGCGPTGCGSSTRSTEPGSSPSADTSTGRCTSRSGSVTVAPTAASPTRPSACPPSARCIAPTPSPPPPPRQQGPIRIATSANRPPPILWWLRDRLDVQLIGIGSAGAKAMAVVRGDVDAYVHAGGQWEWDSAAPAGVVRAAGLHASRIDGSPLLYNRRDPYLPDLLMCRPELAEHVARRHPVGVLSRECKRGARCRYASSNAHREVVLSRTPRTRGGSHKP